MFVGVGTLVNVAVMGLGGLGHMGVKFAVAMGAEVTVLSHSPQKKDDAIAMGVHHFVATNDDSVFKEHAKSFDVILNTVSAELDINKYVSLLKLDGTLVVIGLPGKPYAVHVGSLLDGRRSIAGSMIGGIPQLQEMLNFCGVDNEAIFHIACNCALVGFIDVVGLNYFHIADNILFAAEIEHLL